MPKQTHEGKYTCLIQVWVAPEIEAAIDKDRGLVPRAAYVRKIFDDHFKKLQRRAKR